MVPPDPDDESRTITSIQIAMVEHAKRGLDIESLLTGVQITKDDQVSADWIVRALVPDDEAREGLAARATELAERIRSIVEEEAQS